MTANKFTTTPSPLEVVEKVNAVIDDVAGKLSTSGTAAKATADASGNNIVNTYATKTELTNGLGDKLSTTGTAAKATADASGNTITSTYATKTELTNGLNNKLSTSGTAAKATADASGNTITSTYVTKANAITGLSVSGKVITYTKGNGSTGTITTQDTNTLPSTLALNTSSAVNLTSYKNASWTATGNGVVFFSIHSTSGWNTSYITLNSVEIFRHRAKESGTALSIPVAKGDVLYYNDNNTSTSGDTATPKAYIFMPYK